MTSFITWSKKWKACTRTADNKLLQLNRKKTERADFVKIDQRKCSAEDKIVFSTQARANNIKGRERKNNNNVQSSSYAFAIARHWEYRF